MGRRVALTAATYWSLLGGPKGTGWRTLSTAPRRVSAPMQLLLSQVLEIEAETRQLLPSKGGLTNDGAAAAGGTSPTGASQLQSDVERMVRGGATGAAPASGGPPLTWAEEVVSLAVAVALGTLLAKARSTTFGACGFQQLQADLHLLRAPMRRFSESGSLSVDSLIDRVVTAAADRCAETPTCAPGDRALRSARLQVRAAEPMHLRDPGLPLDGSSNRWSRDVQAA